MAIKILDITATGLLVILVIRDHRYLQIDVV